MLALDVPLAVSLVVVCSFGPGFFFVRRFEWSPLEKLCGSVGLSLSLAYLFFFTLYLLTPSGLGVPRLALFGFSACSLVAIVVAWRHVAGLFRSFRVRRVAGAFSFLLMWTFLIATMIRNYSGANWFGDWLEHFQRSLFFLHHFPVSSPIVFGYQLSARPPAMNELGAFFLGQVSDRFEIFQVIFTFLNLLVFLPCCLIAPALAGRRRTFVLPLTLLFAANPVVMQQVTYTWTKALTAFFVVLALSFYLAGMRKNDSGRILAAFVAASMGMLIHYSAGPYLVFLTLHYLLYTFWKRPRRQRLLETARIAVLSGALLATWFAWSIAVYGMRTTVASNTSVTLGRQHKGRFFEKTASNLRDSIVPAVLRFDPVAKGFTVQGALPSMRDTAFAFYQPNLIFGMGMVGGPLILWLVYRALFRSGGHTAERRFWSVMIPVCVALGIGSTGEQDPRGVAHLTLFSLQLVGLSLLAAAFPWRRRLLWLILVGCTIDFSGGILLHAYVQNLENSSGKTVYAGLNAVGGKPNNDLATPESIGGVAWDNWYLKHQYTLNQQALATLPGASTGHGNAATAQMGLSLAADGFYWHGWYARNGGSVAFLGDHFGDSTWRLALEMSLLVLLLGALLCLTLKKNALLLRE